MHSTEFDRVSLETNCFLHHYEFALVRTKMLYITYFTQEKQHTYSSMKSCHQQHIGTELYAVMTLDGLRK